MISKAELFQSLSGHPTIPRWTQSSPIRPDVWFDYVRSRGGAASVLLIPRRGIPPGRVFAALERNVGCAYNSSVIAANLPFETLLSGALPLSGWWDKNGKKLLAGAQRVREGGGSESLSSDAYHFLRAVGLVLQLGSGHLEPEREEVAALCGDVVGLVDSAAELLVNIPLAKESSRGILFAVSKNRTANISSSASARTVKADAATLLFELGFDDLTWGVLDTGIDATHPAFGRRPAADATDGPGDAIPLARSRVLETYDFNRLRKIMELASSPAEADRRLLQDEFRLTAQDALDLGRRIQAGMDIDWGLLRDALRVEDPSVDRPQHPHGTHVAGILAGCGSVAADQVEGGDDPSAGMCPDIGLIDIRVLDHAGSGDEFQIIAALQFVRYLNSAGEKPVIQGVNLSLQMLHDVREFACGRTPVCDECERLVASGVVVVVAAGNRGFSSTGPGVGVVDNALGGLDVGGYEAISITDPGNAEAVITVGATHGRDPHTYGVSFFSSRGPTGDGRDKPDLLAPGEKIAGPVLDGEYDVMDGTSQAAPHVSGAAAMLMARNRELIGRPAEIKEALMNSATDLKRRRDFQGSGLLDALRALQLR